MVSPSSLATLLMLLMLMKPDPSSSKRSKILLMPFYASTFSTLLSLSPNFEVMASRNYSKSISRPWLSRSAIMWKIVGFLDSKPRLCIAAFSSLGYFKTVPWINFAGALGVEKVESLPDLLDLVFGESWAVGPPALDWCLNRWSSAGHPNNSKISYHNDRNSNYINPCHGLQSFL
jgi:hypothetical protein